MLGESYLIYSMTTVKKRLCPNHGKNIGETCTSYSNGFGKSLPLSWERFQKDLTPIMKKMVGRLYCSSSYSKGFGKSLPLSWERFQKDLTPIMKKMLVRLTAVMGKFRGKLPHLLHRFLEDLLQILQSLLADLQSCREA